MMDIEQVLAAEIELLLRDIDEREAHEIYPMLDILSSCEEMISEALTAVNDAIDDAEERDAD